MNRSSLPRTKGRQKGVATILIILAVGLAVSASVLGVVHEMKSAQERQLSMHAQAPSQAKAWRAAEVVRRYLVQVPQPTLKTWAEAQTAVPLTMSGEGGYQAKLTRVQKMTAPSATQERYQVTAQLVGVASPTGPSKASSVLEVVYQVDVTLPTSTTPTPPDGTVTGALNVFNIYRDFEMTGGIKVIGGEAANFNVDGNVKLDSASIDGINAINATGNVSIGSGIKVNSVNSNGDVNLTGSASVSQIKARGNVTISGGTSSLSIQSNGVTTLVGGTAASVDSIAGIRVTGGGINVSSMRSEGDLLWTGSGGGVSSAQVNGNISYAGANRNPTNLSAGKAVVLTGGGATKVVAGQGVTNSGYGAINDIQAGGDVTLSGSGGATTVKTKGSTTMSGSGNIGTLAGQGNLSVNAWQSVSGQVGGTINKTQQWNSGVNVTRVPGLTVAVEAPAVVTLPEVPEVAVPKPQVIDVYALEPAANYVFKYVNNRIQITVNAVSGIPSGTYVLGNKFQNYNTYPDHLCKPADMNGTTCSKPVATLCQGFSAQNSCFSYSGGQWTVNGQSMARGIAWFDGNLEIGNGVYVNTFLATGNINTAGGHRTISPNYAGFAVVCQNAQPKSSSIGINANFTPLVPTNLCGATEMVKNDLANSAFIAGGYSPTTGAFVGGTVKLGASTMAEGNVIGADVINTGGSTTIKGSVVAAGQDKTNHQPVVLSGSTTIDLTGGSKNYDPTVIPCMKGCEGGVVETPGSTENASSMLWTRYR